MADRSSITPSIVALAGRRVDSPEADVRRFPPSEVVRVAQEVRSCFRREHTARLICSAACGADIVALEAAEHLGVPATIVLPFTAAVFKKTSVADRPGDWGERFDHLVVAARERGDLVELGLDVNEDAFALANDEIVRIADISAAYRRLALVVWEGQSRGPGDSTYDFLCKAMARGFEKRVVLTNRSTG